MGKYLNSRILLGFLIALFLSTSAAAKTITFSGEVTKDQRFEKQIIENLYFCLIPQELGWAVFIGNKADTENNFAGVVTPPYHGINPLSIEGWHFRNADNSGPNEAGEKNINAPQELRQFNFVLNGRDYQQAFDCLQKILWPYSYSPEEVAKAEVLQQSIRMAEGSLTIKEMELNNLVITQQAGMDYMKFDVELHLPPDMP